MNDTKKTIKFIDLCCGIGGFRVGIEQFGNDSGIVFECVLSADIKQDAIDTYNANFQEENTKTDLNTLTDIPDFDLLCAGFPCQPFSSAGGKKGFDDDRGGIIFRIRDICEKHKPTTFILENVSNLLNIKHDGRPVIQVITELFSSIGYHISYKELNSADFGVPQNRRRIFIVGHRVQTIDLENISYKPTKKLREIIDTSFEETTLPEQFVEQLMNYHKTVKPVHGMKIKDSRGSEMNIHSWEIDYSGETTGEQKQFMNKLLTQRRKKSWAVSKGIAWSDGMPLTLNEIQTFWDGEDLKEMLEDLVQKNYLRFEQCKETINKKRGYTDKCPPGYNICKGMLSFPLTRVLDPEGHTPTLTATDSNKLGVVVGETVRVLTVNELKAACGFPADFIVPGHVNAYNLFGNMVTPPVITGLLGVIYSIEPSAKRRKT